MSKINYIQKNRIQCICVIVIYGLYSFLTIEKINTKKNFIKIFIVLNVILRIEITNIWHII